MGAIDSDAHVLETPKTWAYLDGDNKCYTPFIVTQTHGPELKANDGKNTQQNY